MKRMVVRYTTRPESTQENVNLIEQVFKELRAGPQKDLRYLVLRLGDDSFLHIVFDETDGDAIRQVEAFQTFQSGIKERLVDGPRSTEATIVGSYRILDDGMGDRHLDRT